MIKLNAGFSRKVGEPNYGSRGASVNVDLEVESGLINQPDELQGKIRALFALAKNAVDEELNGNTGGNGANNGNGKPHATPAPRSGSNGNGNGNGSSRPDRSNQSSNGNGSHNNGSADTACSKCGRGKIPAKVLKFSIERFGKPVCYRCQQEQNRNSNYERR